MDEVIKEYRYTVPWRRALLALCFSVVFAVAIGHVGTEDSGARLFFALFTLVSMLGTAAFGLASAWQKSRRAKIVVTADSLRVLDVRGRETVIAWADVVWGTGLGPKSAMVTLQPRGTRELVAIEGANLAGLDDLRQEIAARAQLSGPASPYARWWSHQHRDRLAVGDGLGEYRYQLNWGGMPAMALGSVILVVVAGIARAKLAGSSEKAIVLAFGAFALISLAATSWLILRRILAGATGLSVEASGITVTTWPDRRANVLWSDVIKLRPGGQTMAIRYRKHSPPSTGKLTIWSNMLEPEDALRLRHEILARTQLPEVSPGVYAAPGHVPGRHAR